MPAQARPSRAPTSASSRSICSATSMSRRSDSTTAKRQGRRAVHGRYWRLDRRQAPHLSRADRGKDGIASYDVRLGKDGRELKQRWLDARREASIPAPALLRRQPRRAPRHVAGRVRRSRLPRPAVQLATPTTTSCLPSTTAPEPPRRSRRSRTRGAGTRRRPASYEETVEQRRPVSQAMQAFRTFLGESDMLAYLAMMAPRLVELRRVLKPTGSIYLHCDPTASHYLKMLLDAVFGPETLPRTRSSGSGRLPTATAKESAPSPRHHPVLLRRATRPTWNTPVTTCPTSDEYRRASTTASRTPTAGSTARATDQPEPGRPNHDVRVARASLAAVALGYARDSMEKLDDGRADLYSDEGRMRPQLKRYLDEMPGRAGRRTSGPTLPPINSQAPERSATPRRSPRPCSSASSQRAATKATSCSIPSAAAARPSPPPRRLKRRWIGIDITHLAITLIRHRLHDTYGEHGQTYEVIGEPVDR